MFELFFTFLLQIKYTLKKITTKNISLKKIIEKNM